MKAKDQQKIYEAAQRGARKLGDAETRAAILELIPRIDQAGVIERMVEDIRAAHSELLTIISKSTN